MDEARTRIAALLKKDPGVGRASMVLGTIELRANRLSEALVHLERGASQAPDDFIVQSTYGRGLVAQMSEVRADPQAAAAILPRARAALRRATEIEPEVRTRGVDAGLCGAGRRRRRARAAVAALERAIQLDPSREEYRLLLAQALARQGEYDKATALLGPLMASGRSPQIRAEARRFLTDVSNRRAAPASAARPIARRHPRRWPRRPRRKCHRALSRPTIPRRGGSRRLTPQRASGLLLRNVEPGEQRVLGRFQAIDCINGAIVLRVSAEGRVLSLRTRQLADVDFISYRSSAPGNVSCGPQPTSYDVYATYRPAAGTAGIDGEAVAIEVLPDGFTPSNRP